MRSWRRVTVLLLVLTLASPLFAGRTFNGSTDKIAVADHAKIEGDIDGGFVSLACWVRRNGAQARWANVAGKQFDDAAGDRQVRYIFQFNNNSDVAVRFVTELVGSAIIVAGPGALSMTDGVWYFLAGTYDKTRGDVRFYHATGTAALTEVVGDSGSTDLEAGTSFDPFFVSGIIIGGAHTRFFSGDVGQCGVWGGSSALSIGELETFRSGRMPRKPNLHMPLFGASSPEPNYSGAAVNGTLTGTTTADHPPSGPFFGFDHGWQGAFTSGAPPPGKRRIIIISEMLKYAPAPILAGGLGLAWVINRRNKLLRDGRN